MAKNLKLSAPWETLHHEIVELFKGDEDVQISFDEENYIIKLHVIGERKAAALDELLPKEKVFGNVTVKIEVIPANMSDERLIHLIKDAFDGNPNVDEIVTLPLPTGDTVNYVLFSPEVVQFFNDDISDPRGLETTLCEKIAKDLIKKEGLFFSTQSIGRAKYGHAYRYNYNS